MSRRLSIPRRLLTGIGLGLVGLLAGCAAHQGRPADAAPTATPPEVGFAVDRDRVYTPAGWPTVQRADLYRPALPGPRPAVLLIHGGGWAEPERRHQMVSIAERLARRGYVVVNATYRLAPTHLHPAGLEDLRMALRWMRQSASSLGIDPQRIAAFGYSAGGHLAALLGGLEAPSDQQVQAVVAGGAPTDLAKWPNGKLVVQYLGGTLAAMPARYAEASPVQHVDARDPPVFLYHGGFDLLVPIDHAEDYKTALDQAGVPNELYIQRGLGHITAFFLDQGAVDAAIDFLDRRMGPQ